MSPITATPGFFPYMSDDEYFALDAVNQSSLKKLLTKTPAHLRHILRAGFPETPALAFGKAYHSLILWPETFSETYHVMPKFDMRTKAGKAGHEEHVALAGDKSIITDDDYDIMCDMERALKGNPDVAAILNHPTRLATEFVTVWIDPETGLICKAKGDLLFYSEITGDALILDLKTTDGASEGEFRRDLLKYGYHIQAASYCEGLKASDPERFFGKVQFGWILQEKSKPYLSRLVRGIGDTTRKIGLFTFHELLKEYAVLAETPMDNWGGYASIETAELPDYMLRRFEDGSDFEGILPSR